MRQGSTTTKITILIVVVGAILASGFWVGWGLSGVKQPIQFPHKTHIALQLPCTGCHQRAENDDVAGRPPTSLCMSCHSGGESQSPEIKKLLAFGQKGQEIPWRRVWRLPSHVFFPHRVHVVAAKIECQRCHGPMETLTRPPARPLKVLTMDDCIACHETWKPPSDKKEAAVKPVAAAKQRFASDCITCHR